MSSHDQSSLPPEIAAMDYRACPVCGADNMIELPGREIRKWRCRECRNINFATVPNAEQQEIARLVFTPYANPYDSDQE